MKEQNKLSMTWMVVEKSVPDYAQELVDIRDELKSKFGLKKLLEFLYKYSYDESDSRSSCSSAFCTSSNIDQKISSLKESVIFAELYLELSHEDWTEKLEKMGRYAEKENADYSRKSIKLFIPFEFLTEYAIIIRA